MKVYEKLGLLFLLVLTFYFFLIGRAVSQGTSLSNAEIIDRLKLAVDWCENRECQVNLGKCLMQDIDVRNCFAK